MRFAWMLVGMLVSAPALADPDPTISPPGVTPEYRPAPMKQDIVVTVDKDREPRNIALVAGIAGVGALFGGIGVYYNLDSRDAANTVSSGRPTGMAWGAGQQADYDRAHSSGVKAGIFYGLGGAALIGAVVALIVTSPGTETTVIHPHYTPTVAPAHGGAILGGAWSF